MKFTVASRAPKAHIYVAFFAVAGDIVAVRAAIQLGDTAVGCEIQKETAGDAASAASARGRKEAQP